MGERFVVHQVLGQAQFGRVLLCELREPPASPTAKTCASASASARLVAVKRLQLQRIMKMARAGLTFESPFDEAHVATQARRAGGHPHVLQYHDCFLSDGHLHLVMELCERGDLFETLRRSGAPQPGVRPPDALTALAVERRALCVLAQVAAGLRFLHRDVGVAHRDVSLENILLTRRGECKLADFGLCVAASARPRKAAGKPAYMAPEVLAPPARGYNPCQADVWSLGIVLWIALTGSPLVTAATPTNRAFRAFRDMGGVRAVLAAWGLLPSLHEATVELCDALLQVDPRRRVALDDVLTHPALALAGPTVFG